MQTSYKKATFWIFFFNFEYWQQIHESQAKQLCHKYRNISTKKKDPEIAGEKKSKYEKKIVELQTTVQKAARSLCRKILRYQGITWLILQHSIRVLCKNKNINCVH